MQPDDGEDGQGGFGGEGDQRPGGEAGGTGDGQAAGGRPASGRAGSSVNFWRFARGAWVRDDRGVTIVFGLPPSAAERVAFSYSPAMEAVLSLHVLVEPKHHPVQHEWVRAMRRLSPALKREVEVFGFAYRAYFPEFFFPPAAGELLDCEGELRRLRGVDEQLVRMEFAVPCSARLWVDERDRHGGPGRGRPRRKTWVWGPQVSRVLGIAAPGLAVAVVFVPGLALGLQHVGNTGQMGGMWRGCRAGGASYGYAVTRGARARRVVNGAQPRPNGRWMR